MYYLYESVLFGRSKRFVSFSLSLSMLLLLHMTMNISSIPLVKKGYVAGLCVFFHQHCIASSSMYLDTAVCIRMQCDMTLNDLYFDANL